MGMRRGSRRRDSNPRPAHYECAALPAELRRQAPSGHNPGAKHAEGQNRTGDTRIFSPLLYQLSYLGADLPALPHTHALVRASPGIPAAGGNSVGNGDDGT